MRCRSCGHPASIHFDAEGQPVACRLTGCPCPGLAEPDQGATAPESRRVCIDLPDGYTISISLIPWGGGDVVSLPVETDEVE